tara:strand:- start:5451 stop:5810 length:360 start_codon:yes stop_codon:yes gene_type:complete
MILHYAMADSSGRILQTLSGPYSYTPCEEDVSDTTHYVDAGSDVILAKSPLDYDFVVEELTVTVTGLPEGLSVSTNGLTTITDAEPLVINYDVPGTYTLRLRGRVEYLDEDLEVTVGDA